MQVISRKKLCVELLPFYTVTGIKTNAYVLSIFIVLKLLRPRIFSEEIYQLFYIWITEKIPVRISAHSSQSAIRSPDERNSNCATAVRSRQNTS